MSRPRFEVGDTVWYDGMDMATPATKGWVEILNNQEGEENGELVYLVRCPKVNIHGHEVENVEQSILEGCLHEKELVE